MEDLVGLKAFDRERYENIDLDRLVLYAASKVQDAGLELSFENIVVASYRLFPEKFSLFGYPSFPDAKRVHDALFHCTYKNKQWLGGKTRTGFIFTSKGLRILEQARSRLVELSSLPKKQPSKAKRENAVLAEIVSSVAFQKYKNGEQDKITQAEVCFALMGTLDSSKETLLSNLQMLMEVSEKAGEKGTEFQNFLRWLKGNFSDLLSSLVR